MVYSQIQLAEDTIRKHGSKEKESGKTQWINNFTQTVTLHRQRPAALIHFIKNLEKTCKTLTFILSSQISYPNVDVRPNTQIKNNCKLGSKEQRWMTDQNHKISRQIVNFTVKQGVSVIELERLKNVRNTARISRKNAENLHKWSFYQLLSLIQCEANMVGIWVAKVNLAFTSQTCPNCGK